MKYVHAILVIVGVLAMSASAQGDLITYTTPDGATMDGHPVSATVSFETKDDWIWVFLENLQADPKSVVQNLSSLLFTVSTGQTTGTLTSSLGAPRTVASNKTYTDGPVADTGWQVRTTDGQLDLHVLGTPAGPAHTIIGPPDGSNKYGKAKGSIKGSPSHNPFLAENATFELEVLGVTEGSSIAAVTFGFGTSAGDIITVPEPTTLCLLGGMTGVWAVVRRRRV